MRTCKSLTTVTNVITVLWVLGFQEGDEVPFVCVKFTFSLNIREKSVNSENVAPVLAHRVEQMRRPCVSFGTRKFILKILPQVISLVLPDIVLSGDVVDDEINEHFSTSTI
jgi:beta-lactamase regulating signal transducer with metallopeptidase domain